MTRDASSSQFAHTVSPDSDSSQSSPTASRFELVSSVEPLHSFNAVKTLKQLVETSSSACSLPCYSLPLCKHCKWLQVFSQFLSNTISNRGTSFSVARQQCSDRPPFLQWAGWRWGIESTCVSCATAPHPVFQISLRKNSRHPVVNAESTKQAHTHSTKGLVILSCQNQSEDRN